MVTLFGAATTPETVLTAITAKIVADAVVPAHLVYPSLAPDEELKTLPPADQFVTLKPQRFIVRRGDQTGGGRSLLSIDGQWEAAVWTRLDLDLAGRSNEFIGNQTLGAMAKFRALLNSLEQYSPLNASGVCILFEPMRLTAFDLSPRAVKPGWGKLASSWEVSFVMELS